MAASLLQALALQTTQAMAPGANARGSPKTRFLPDIPRESNIDRPGRTPQAVLQPRPERKGRLLWVPAVDR